MPLHHISSSLASRVLLVRPAAFGFNAATASSNFFQEDAHATNLSVQALKEFDRVVSTLEANKIQATVLNDAPLPPKPDAIFPNNWFSTHAGGGMILYAMEAPNRRDEITHSHMDALAQIGYHLMEDLREEAAQHRFLEGTGSLVFDHAQRFVVAAVSSRTHPQLAERVAARLGYQLLLLNASDAKGMPVYHTNVVLSIAPTLAIVCFEAISTKEKAAQLQMLLEIPGRSVLSVSKAQMHAFCCNVLVVSDSSGMPCVVLSETAWNAFSSDQQKTIQAAARPVILHIPTIERVGGGSARCMLAELF